MCLGGELLIEHVYNEKRGMKYNQLYYYKEKKL